MRTLIVDDSLLANHAIKSYFFKMNFEVIGLAKNGEAAKEMVINEKPELVTIDYVMPGISGVEVAKHINKIDRENNRRTRIIMISSDEIPADERAMIKVDAYILKPITLAKLKQAINDF